MLYPVRSVHVVYFFCAFGGILWIFYSSMYSFGLRKGLCFGIKCAFGDYGIKRECEVTEVNLGKKYKND